MGLIQKAFSDIITFSRSSNATRVGPTGLVEYAPHNLILQSQTFDNASWTKTNCTATANAASAPDGTVTADNLATSSANSSISQAISISANTQTYTQSLYVKYVSGSVNFRIRAALVGGTAIATYLSMNAQTGAFVAGDSTYTITSVGNGWYRITITIANNGTNTTFAFQAYPTNDVSSTNEMSVWGAQLAVGPYALDYTPTTSAAVYGPRFDFDPVTLAARGLLIEEQRTNLLTYSEQFDNAAWATPSANATVSANTTAAPDGTVTADSITAVAGAGYHYANRNSPSVLTGAYTVSFFVKKNTNTWIFFTVNDSGLNYFNLDTGSFGNTADTCTVQAFGNGWYRIAATRTLSSAQANCGIGLANGNGGGSFTAAGTESVYVWGAQLE